MPIVVYEKFESRDIRKGEDTEATLRYVITGTDDEFEALSALENNAPLLYYNLVRKNYEIEQIAPGTWEANVEYGLFKIDTQERQTGGSSYQFDISTTSERINYSKQTIAIYGPDPKPNFKNAINVQDDEVQGVDILVPQYSFSETHYLSVDTVTSQFKAYLFWTTGKVNDAPFKGFQKGEVLFLGASGDKRSDADWEITFRYIASPNVSNLTIGDIQGINKEGWQYLWILFKEENHAGRRVKRPNHIYIEQIYDYADFSGLP